MSKPFAVKVVQNDVLTLQTDDAGSAKIILDQTLPLGDFTVQILTNAFNKGIRLKNNPQAFLEIEGGNAQINVSNGNLAENTAQLFMLGAGDVTQNMLTVDNSITVDPALPLYDQLDTTGAPGINVISRVNIVPDALGTRINSILVNTPNPDGREIWFQNFGTAVGQTLTFGNLSGAGTAGGLILAPGLVDYVIPPGGGGSLMFDKNPLDGLWLIRARS